MWQSNALTRIDGSRALEVHNWEDLLLPFMPPPNGSPPTPKPKKCEKIKKRKKIKIKIKMQL